MAKQPGRLIGILLVVTACCAIASTMTAQIQQPSTVPAPRPLRLRVHVVAADNGAPVRRAIVRLSPSEYVRPLPGTVTSDGANTARVAETNDDGRFEFDNLRRGLHSVTIEPEAGFVRPVRSRDVTLDEGPVRDLTIRLERTGAIVGEVRDERGTRVPGAVVQALTRREFSNVPVANLGARALTDDRGQFRIFNLTPGDYYVVATLERRFTDLVDAPHSGYASTYHPRARGLRDARLVAVSAGRDVRDVNVDLIPTRFATLAVQVADSRGVPFSAQASVTLTPIDEGDVYRSNYRSPIRPPQDGRFVFPALPPGTFILVAATEPGAEDASYVRVTVGTEDMSLSLRTNTGAAVSGRVVVDDRPDSYLGTVQVWAQRPEGVLGVGYNSVKISVVPPRMDRFELTGLRGPMVLTAEMSGAALTSIRRAGEDISGKTLLFDGTETMNDVVVEFTTNVAQVDATVISKASPDEPENAMVVLFPEAPARWVKGIPWDQGHLRYADVMVSQPRATQPSSGTDGAWRESGSKTVSLGRMVPGRYLIVAIPRPQYDDVTHPRVLERLRPLAMPITLTGGATSKVDVRVTPFRATRPR